MTAGDLAGKKRESAGSLVRSERGGQAEVTFVLIPHSSPINLLGGNPSLPCCLTALSLSSCVTSSAVRPRRGRSFSWLLDGSRLPHLPVSFSFQFSHLSDIYSSVYRSFEFIIRRADRSDMWAMQTNRGKQRK